MKPHRSRLALFVLLMAGMGAAYDLVCGGGPRSMMNGCLIAGLVIAGLVELYALIQKVPSRSADKATQPADAPRSPLTPEQVQDWLQKIWMRQEKDGALLGKIHLELQKKGLMSSTEASPRFDIHMSKKAPPVPIVRDEESLKTMNNRAGMETGFRWALRGTRSRGGVFMGYASCTGTWTTDKHQVQTFPSAGEAMKACPKRIKEGSVVVTAVLYH